MKLRRFKVFVLLLIFPLWGHSLEFEKEFTDSSEMSSGDIVWDISRGQLLPPIQVINYNSGGGPTNLDLDPGDGSDGSFNINTYANFSVNNDVSGEVITIDTDVYTELQFTQFTLNKDWTLRPVGSNPLIIKVQDEVIINGVIDCSGEDGEGINDDETVIARGGRGVCGGADGGDGGSLTLTPEPGSDGGASVTGGGEGLALSDGGGGGGGYDGDGFASTDPKTGLDAAGANINNEGSFIVDNDFTELGGGSGGGGGRHYTGGTVDQNSSGGGGGAGGGVVIITTLSHLTVGPDGKILANGGAGGSGGSDVLAGGGGGGAGGSIAVYAVGNISVEGEVDATYGDAGTTTEANSGDGGHGGNGRTWLVDIDLFPTVTGTLDPGSFLGSPGAVRFKTGTFTMTSKEYDLLNSYPEMTSATLNDYAAGGSSVTLEFSLGSEPDFTPVTWETVDSLTQSPSRYFRYRISIDNQVNSDPAYIEGFTLEYTPYSEEDFKFTGGCGSVKAKTPPHMIALIWSLLLLPFFFVLGLRQKAKN